MEQHTKNVGEGEGGVKNTTGVKKKKKSGIGYPHCADHTTTATRAENYAFAVCITGMPTIRVMFKHIDPGCIVCGRIHSYKL